MTAPAPLTPPNCNLRDFAFMPLEVGRLRRSKAWLLAKRKPELGFYMMNLWCGAWHESPAASLEDDDDVLADVAMCDPLRWAEVREEVLRGWVKCSDGRLYHPTVAEKAAEAWERKERQRDRGRKGNEARWSDRRSLKDASGIAEGSGRDPSGIAQASRKDRESVAGLRFKDRKGQGQGEGQGEEKESFALSSPGGDGAPAAGSVPPPVRTAEGVTEEEEGPPPDPVLEAYVIWRGVCGEALGYPRALTDPRRRALAARLRDTFGNDLDRWRAYLGRIAASSFLTGGGERGWRADFDWTLKPANVVKVLEGGYDDRRPSAAPARPAQQVDERYFDRPAADVARLPKPALNTPEYHAFIDAGFGRTTPHPSKRRHVPIA